MYNVSMCAMGVLTHKVRALNLPLKGTLTLSWMPYEPPVSDYPIVTH